MWIWNDENKKMENKEITYVPGLFKIFDEIIVNAADNKVRDPKMSLIKIQIDKEKNEISVFNNGKGTCFEKNIKKVIFLGKATKN
jgi:DNA topoisomerase-2